MKRATGGAAVVPEKSTNDDIYTNAGYNNDQQQFGKYRPDNSFEPFHIFLTRLSQGDRKYCKGLT